VNARQEFALTRPLNGPDDDVEPYRSIVVQPDGNLLMSVLAVDR
jgi:hypothetical protein